MEIGNNNNALNRVLTEYAPAEEKTAPANKELGRDAFLKLLIAQLENQDPTKPEENGEFIAQLAQFSQLEETQKLGGNFEEFASAFQSTKHLQATSLVGRPVHVESEFSPLGESGAISVLAEFDEAVQSASLTVYNKGGEIVDSFELGQQPAGRQEFIWTGTDANDERFPPGDYYFEVSSSGGEEASSVPVYLSANVNSVTIESGGALTLNLAGIGKVSMDDIIQIN
ncbi:MAG: flagellar hook assembly protein FlgD [Pseudohongiella sp.]|uniref:flagellar hook assembly protein FlgD n=1 Tax=Pseudohongiella sp. TaxID=1979412 RepID=UPI0034A0A5E0